MSATTTTSDHSLDTPVVDTLLEAIRAGRGIPEWIYAPDAVLDATVPNWRFTVIGPAAISAEYSRWFACPAVTEELDVHRLDGGIVVRYLLTWHEQSVPHAAHHAHILTLDTTGRIHKDVVFCGGRWDAALLAQIAEANS